MFTLDLNNAAGKSTIRVYDIVGNVIHTSETTSNTKQTLDLSTVANGSYFVSITNNTTTTTKKIVVNK
ncbi:MAG: T9SS type A sorting domain-containing protein [Bacteroidetes bacterium]|nr:T9SS type A sorting domain-containing protein [Bacteroidota bacterium]